MKDYTSLMLAWSGAALSAVTNHLNLIISGAAALAALIASLYSIKINRAKWRKIKAHEEAVCRACAKNAQAVECPFPEDERPETCPLTRATPLKPDEK